MAWLLPASKEKKGELVDRKNLDLGMSKNLAGRKIWEFTNFTATRIERKRLDGNNGEETRRGEKSKPDRRPQNDVVSGMTEEKKIVKGLRSLNLLWPAIMTPLSTVIGRRILAILSAAGGHPATSTAVSSSRMRPANAPEGFYIETLVVGPASEHCLCKRTFKRVLLGSSIDG